MRSSSSSRSGSFQSTGAGPGAGGGSGGSPRLSVNHGVGGGPPGSRRASSVISMAGYPYGGGSSAYTSHPRLSIRTPILAPSPPTASAVLVRACAGRATRRVALFAIVILGSVVWLVWPGSSPNSSSRLPRSSARDDPKCRLMPWLDQCSTLNDGRNPFDMLHFERKAGFMYYPGHATTERKLDNGAVEEVDYVPPQPHPIHLLVDKAKRDWDKKVKRQSQTLQEAVEEYERRYGRRPPKGFSDWWFFAKGVDFKLVDEFDSLNENILPFLALPSSTNRKRSEKIQFDEEFWIQDKTFTIELKDLGKQIGVHGPMAGPLDNPDVRSTQARELIEGIAKYLPDMNITVTGHDNPWVVLSGEARAKLRARAQVGLFVDKDDEDAVHDNWDYDGWAVVCPPYSALRSEPPFDRRAKNMDSRPEPRPSLIQDHTAAMDLCDHPEFQPIHGFSAWPGPRPGLLYPLFTFTKTPWHSDLLMPPIDQYNREVGPDPEWEDKKHDKMVWRGTTTGADLNNKHMRDWSQRMRLCRLPAQRGNLTLPVARQDKSSGIGPIEDFSAPATELASSYFDVKFLGQPQQCGEACDEIKREFEWDKWMSTEEQNQYKYVIDVDGNGWSGRFHRLMSSNSLVFKSTIFPEWYSDRVQPWLHYVPISPDYSDLWTAMAFFKGDLAGQGSHDAMAKEIAYAGKQWAQEFWRWEDMQVYLYRLLLEYARIMLRSEDNPNSMDM